MKIKYKRKGFISILGVTFEKFSEKEVSDEIGKELLKQPTFFEEVKNKTNIVDTIKTQEVKATIKDNEKEPQVETQKKPSPKKPTRRTRTKAEDK